jgi:peptidoglycan/LPS O-acetylase OafA/YrhL
LARYAVSRLARIYPAYALSVAVVSFFILRWILKPSPDWHTKAVTLFNYVFVLQGWRRSDPGWNTPAWSLSCELFFYLCFPVILPLVRHARLRMIAALAALSVAGPVLLAHTGVPSFWKPIRHLGDFTMGMAAARVYALLSSRCSNAKWASWLYWTAFLAGVGIIASPGMLRYAHLDLNAALCPLDAAALIGLALGGGAPAKLLSSRWAQYLGHASYSMYILHIPLLWWYGNGGLRRLHLPPAPAAFVYTAGVVAAAVISLEYIEKPANDWIKSWAARTLAPARQLKAAA